MAVKSIMTSITSKKMIILPILIGVIVLAGGVGSYFLINSHRYFSTDNAKVTAKMYHITPNSAGELLEWNVEEGQRVKKSQVLGRQAVLPYITSPIDGMVVENDAVEGEMVSPATQLAVVADTNNMYIGINVEETDITKIHVGQRVDVKIDAYSGKTFKGVVEDIDETTQTYFSNATSFSTSGTYTKVTQLIPVKVVIENPDNLPLTFGMNATVKINIQEKNPPAPEKTEATAKSPVDYTSSIEAADKMTVTPNTAGKVSKVNVDVGDKVKSGEVLFTLDGTDAALQVKQAEANLPSAQTAYDEAVAGCTRMQTLFDQGAVSQVDLDTANAKKEAALGQLNSLKAALDIAQKRLADCTVRSPMSGEVSSRDIDVGDMASPQAPALTLIDASSVILHIDVTETHISEVKIGTGAEIDVQAIDATGEGKVTNIAPTADPKTGMFDVEIKVPNEDGKFRPGMTADVTL